ncbi:MAG: hypothetical protein ACREGR_01100, partial [Minisyncoccia bacterium]
YGGATYVTGANILVTANDATPSGSAMGAKMQVQLCPTGTIIPKTILTLVATGVTYGLEGLGTAMVETCQGEADGTGFVTLQATADANGPAMTFEKARGSLGTPSAVSTGDTVGTIIFNGYGASAYKTCAQIVGSIAETSPSNTAMGGTLKFSVTPIGSVTPSTVFKLKSTGLFMNASIAPTYTYNVPVTGFSLTIGAGIDNLILDPAGTLATGTVTMPAAPLDGQRVTIASSHIVTTLTVQGNTGQTLDGTITSIAANGFATWIYLATPATWYRVG